MCFSAGASFAVSGGLAVMGVDALRVAPRKQRILAAIPLLFAVQQALEGIQWLYLKAGSVCTVAGYGYLAFAFALWPLYIPIAVYLLDKADRRVVKWFVVLGALIAAWDTIPLLYEPLRIYVSSRGLVIYDVLVPYGRVAAALYVATVSGALLASRVNALRIGGFLTIFTAVVAMGISAFGFVSLWCFVAAIVSSAVWFALRTSGISLRVARG